MGGTGSRANVRRVVARGLALLVIAAPLGPARADHRTSFVTSGSCAPEIGFFVPVDAERARAAIDDPRFVVEEVGGLARLGVFAEVCDTATNGGDPSRAIIGGVFVATDAAASVGGCQSYDFFWTSNVEDDWVRANRDLGFGTGVAASSAFSVDKPDGVVTHVEAAIPFEPAPWSMTLGAVEPTLPPVPYVSVHCHAGPRGVVRGTFDHDFPTASAGLGEVRFGRSALWEALDVRPIVRAAGLDLPFHVDRHDRADRCGRALTVSRIQHSGHAHTRRGMHELGRVSRQGAR